MLAHRAVTLAAVAGLIVALPAGAKPSQAPRTRIVTIAYTQPCSVNPAPTGGNGSVAMCPADQHFTTLKGEKSATVTVTDASGRPAAVALNVATDGVSDQLPTLICGSAKVDISGGDEYVANPSVDLGEARCPTPPTSGTIKIVLSR